MSVPVWWNSVDTLSKVADGLTGTAAVLGLFACLAASIAWRTGLRLGTLKDAELATLRARAEGTAAVLGLLAGLAALMAWQTGLRLGTLKDAELATLRARTEVRHLPDPTLLLQRLPRVNRAPAYLFSSGFDTETTEYSDEILKLLAASGWNVSSSRGGVFPRAPGVTILLPPADHPTRLPATQLRAVLKEAGVVTYALATPPIEAQMNQMVVLVGRRP